jgi:hypothetical protein
LETIWLIAAVGIRLLQPPKIPFEISVPVALLNFTLLLGLMTETSG